MDTVYMPCFTQQYFFPQYKYIFENTNHRSQFTMIPNVVQILRPNRQFVNLPNAVSFRAVRTWEAPAATPCWRGSVKSSEHQLIWELFSYLICAPCDNDVSHHVVKPACEPCTANHQHRCVYALAALSLSLFDSLSLSFLVFHSCSTTLTVQAPIHSPPLPPPPPVPLRLISACLWKLILYSRLV